MKKMVVLLLVSCIIFLNGCGSTYQKFVKKELQIPNVYMPPNNADHPYTLFAFRKNSNFQSICPATLLTGLSEEEILRQRKENDIAAFGVAKNSSAKFDIKLEKSDIGDFDAKYSRINKLELTLNEGKVYSLPNVGVSQVVDKIKSTHCKEDVKVMLEENPDLKFYIPTHLYAFSLQYHIYTEDGVDVTAELPNELTKTIMGKVGLNYTSTSDMKMTGKNLYVGFRGTGITRTIAGIASPSSVVPQTLGVGVEMRTVRSPLYESSEEILYDVTEDVTEILKESVKL